MSIPKYQDEAAFPQPHLMRLEHSQRDDVVLPAQWGLTKREYFAALAMQGLCANSIPGSHHYFPNVATDAVQYADALIAELAKTVR